MFIGLSMTSITRQGDSLTRAGTLLGQATGQMDGNDRWYWVAYSAWQIPI